MSDEVARGSGTTTDDRRRRPARRREQRPRLFRAQRPAGRQRRDARAHPRRRRRDGLVARRARSLAQHEPLVRARARAAARHRDRRRRSVLPRVHRRGRARAVARRAGARAGIRADRVRSRRTPTASSPSERRVDGVFLADLRAGDERLALVESLGLAAVTLGHPDIDSPFPAVSVDDVDGMIADRRPPRRPRPPHRSRMSPAPPTCCTRAGAGTAFEAACARARRRGPRRRDRLQRARRAARRRARCSRMPRLAPPRSPTRTT